MRILVTGYNGKNKSFIAKRLISHFKELGHTVYGWEFDENYETKFYGWIYSDIYKKYVHALPTSYTNNPDWDCGDLPSFDIVFHLGAITDTTETNVEKVLERNFDFSVWLLGQCQMNNIPFHYASSSSVYGQSKNFSETTPVQPQSPYAWSKALFDRVVVNNLSKFKAPVLGFRYFNVYGMGEEHKGEQMSVVSKFQKQAEGVESEILLFKGSENFERDVVCVDDICKMHEKLLDCKESGIYNVGTGKTVNIKQLAEKVSDLTGCSIYEIDMPDNLKNQYQEYTCSDNRKLESIVDMEWTDVNDYLEHIYCKL